MGKYKPTFYATVIDLTDTMRRNFLDGSFGVRATSYGTLLRAVRHTGYQRRATTLAAYVTNDARSTFDCIVYQSQPVDRRGTMKLIEVNAFKRIAKQDAAVLTEGAV